jgi:hypothetical protein
MSRQELRAMTDQDDLFGYDDGDADEFEALYTEFRALVFDFGDDQSIPTSFLSAMCLSVAIEARMADYVLDTAQPSVSGLRRDLDRMLREFETTLRNAKREAADYVEAAKQAIRERDEDPDAGDDEELKPED